MSQFILPSRATDANNNPLSGALLYFYYEGTTTPADVYSDADRSTVHANPVVANSGGLLPPIYLSPDISYRAVLKTSAGGTLDEYDPYTQNDTITSAVANFGAVGGGVVDDTAALQRALNSGRVVALKAGETYLITSGLEHVSGAGFVCFDGMATIKAKTGVGGFSNVLASAPRNGLDRNMLRCNGTDNLTLLNVHFTTDNVTPVVLHGVRMMGGMGTEGYDLQNISFSRFFVGSMVALGSTGTGRKRNIHIASAVDSGTSNGSTYFTAGAQMTVVEIDNDIVASTPSKEGVIRIDLIRDILFSGTALTNFGQETDGVNIVCQGANSTAGWDISIGTVERIGEAVDIQGWRCNVNIGTARNIYNTVVKLTHGAQYNTVTVGTALASGQSVVTIAGSVSPVADRDTKGNVVRVGTVTLPGTYGLGLTGESQVILFANANSTWKPTGSVVEVGTVIGDSVNLDYVVRDGGASANNDNLVRIGKASGYAIVSASAPPSNVRAEFLGRAATELRLSAGQVIPTGVATQLLFNTVVADTESLAVTASSLVRVKFPGVYRVTAQIRMDSWGVGTTDKWTLDIRQGPAIVAAAIGRIQFSAKDEAVFISKDIYVDESVLATSATDFTVYVTQDTGANKTVTNATGYTHLTVTRIN